MLFEKLLQTIIKREALVLITADGREHYIGDGSPARVVVRLHRKSLEWKLGFNPQLKVGEAYMRGDLTIERGTLRDFFRVLFINFDQYRTGPLLKWLGLLNRPLEWLGQFNPLARARRNAAYHYDMPDQLYEYFLDSDRQYSCAYFTRPGNDLEQAQLDKKRHIAAKLVLDRPNLRVLDIGCGWGGMALYLAKEAGCRVKGITLSTNQYKYSRQRAGAAGLARTCTFELLDYRQEKASYDRIVSVGMFEHVGKQNYEEFFASISRLLSDDGVCLLHAIGRFNEPGPVNAFIRKHIFPGADVAVLSEVLPVIEKSGLYVTDIEILRLHYAETLRLWDQRFEAHREQVVALYGEEFFRKWKFYLISCEMGFRYENMMVYQIQLSKRLETAPITRDYMYNWEQAHKPERMLLPARAG